MSGHYKAIQDSVFVDVQFLDYPTQYKNKFAGFWKSMPYILIGTNDLRARLGEFNTPWKAKSNPLYKPPAFAHINDSLADIMNERALEIFENSKRLNKKIAIMWSGGIDSTAVLVSFLKNLNSADLSNICIICNTVSIMENLEFYSKYISNRIECLHYSMIDVNNDFLNKYILIHGDPGDCLFGPSTPLYSYFIQNNQHLDPFKNHLDKMAELLDPGPAHSISVPGFGKWYVDKITNNLVGLGLDDQVTTIADWWWWTYYNFKWEFSCQRPLFFSRRNLKGPIEEKNLIDYSQNVYFGSDKFQQWSFTNLKRLIGRNVPATHKEDAKKYIFEFDGNEYYTAHKHKLGGLPANYELRVNRNMPLYYEQDWTGHSIIEGTGELKTVSNIIMEMYEG